MPADLLHGLTLNPDQPRLVLIGEGVGVAAVLALAETLVERRDAQWRPLVLLHADRSLRLRIRPSTIMVAGMPAGVIAGVSRLDEQGIASRLSSDAGLPGCHAGSVTELAEAWLATLATPVLPEVALLVCATAPVLHAATQLAQRHAVTIQTAPL